MSIRSKVEEGKDWSLYNFVRYGKFLFYMFVFVGLDFWKFVIFLGVKRGSGFILGVKLMDW